MSGTSKNICLITVISFIVANVFSQDISTTINFINVSEGGCKKTPVNVFLNDQLAGSIKSNENLACKLLSVGKIRLTFATENSKILKSIDIDSGRIHFYKINCSSDEYHPVYREYQGKEMLSRMTNTKEFKEDASHPIIFSKTLKDYSIINFLTNRCTKDNSFSIYLNEQLVGSINQNENLEYKVYSEGRISVTLIINSSRVTKTIDVSNNNTYYFEISNLNGKYELVDEETGMGYLSKVTNTVKAGESKRQPLIPKSSEIENTSQGTCFLISSNGYLITNYHVIENAKEITVKGIDGDFVTKYGASVVGSDPSNDLALLKIGNKNVKFNNPPFALRSSGVAQAEKVYALGFPAAEAMGQEVKITEGIISSKSGIGNDISKFQISAAVNHGNSGGPLIDEQGNLIGVIFAKSTIAESAGYAVKASYLETFLRNVDGFEIPNLTNTIKDKPLTDKVAELKNFIFIVETN